MPLLPLLIFNRKCLGLESDVLKQINTALIVTLASSQKAYPLCQHLLASSVPHYHQQSWLEPKCGTGLRLTELYPAWPFLKATQTPLPNSTQSHRPPSSHSALGGSVWVVCGLGVLEGHPASTEAQLSVAKVRTGADKRNQGKIVEVGGSLG